ncbi:RBCMT [Symbiodinium sp. CCMP2592]|nr:RBCMT [Symbiodinium sp. CCMP2592]
MWGGAKAEALGAAEVEELSDRVALILLLIQETSYGFHRERYVHGKDSKWFVYMRSLPQFDGDVSGPSFLWTEDELEWLQGSDGYGAAAAMYNTIVDEYVALNESLFQEHSEKFPSNVFTFDRFLWGAATVASRAYGDDAEGTHLCIAPLVDFLNHRAGALQLTRFGNGIVAYAHKHYDVGEQVWVSYGGKSNAELLSQYGFVDPDNGQEAVYIRLGVHLQATGENAAQKMALIQDLLEGAEPEGAIFKLALRPREWEPRLLPILRTLAWSDEEPLPKDAKELVPRQSPEVESQAYAVLEAALMRRASEYPATLAADREQLKAGGLSERNALGLKLRISEQELIELIQTYAVGERSRESESA